MASVKVRVVSAIGEGLSGLWGFYSIFTTASDLPKDAGEFAKMMADPPIYLPWIIAATFLVALAWAFWPSKKKPIQNPTSPSGDMPHIKIREVGEASIERNRAPSGRPFLDVDKAGKLSITDND